MRRDQVAIVILNYKTWEDTLNEAKMVHDCFDLNWKQIIIVDNASPNESAEQLKKKTIGDYVFIETGANKGYAFGNNIGLKYAFDNNYKYAWVLNNDIILNDKRILGEMLRVFDSDDDVAVVNPDIYAPDGHLFNRDSVRPSFFDFTIGFLAYRKKGRRLHKRRGYGYVYRPQGCCMMVDLSKLNDVGYLDEHTFLYCEELILAEKLLKFNWKCACAYRISVVHNHSKTVKSNFGKWKVIKTQNESFEYYLDKYRGYSLIKRKLCLFFYSIKNYVTN